MSGLGYIVIDGAILGRMPVDTLVAAGIRTPASGTAGACVIGFSPLELPIKSAGDIDGGNADNDYNNY